MHEPFQKPAPETRPASAPDSGPGLVSGAGAKAAPSRCPPRVRSALHGRAANRRSLPAARPAVSARQFVRLADSMRLAGKIRREIPQMLPTRNQSSDARSRRFEASGLGAPVIDPPAQLAGPPPPDTGRRGFFRRLAAGRANTAATSAPQPAAPALRVSARCMNHGFCAAICPTRALRRYETGTAAGIAFDAAACDGCGLCVRACVQHALRLDRSGTLTDPAGRPLVLSRFELRHCPVCGKPFAHTGEAAWCTACRTRGRLGRDLFGSVFALR